MGDRLAAGAIWTLSVLMALAAATLYWLLVQPLDQVSAPWSTRWMLALTAAFAAAEVLVVHLRLGKDAYTFSLMEIPLILGLFFVPPDLLVAARLLGAGLTFVARRKAPQKAAYNGGLFALETVAAVVCFHLVLAGADPLGPHGWLATFATAALTGLLGSTMVSVAIALSTGEMPRSLSEVYSLGPAGDVVNACFALVSVYILNTDWRAGWLLGVVAGVLVLAYRGYEGSRRR